MNRQLTKATEKHAVKKKRGVLIVQHIEMNDVQVDEASAEADEAVREIRRSSEVLTAGCCF